MQTAVPKMSASILMGFKPDGIVIAVVIDGVGLGKMGQISPKSMATTQENTGIALQKKTVCSAVSITSMAPYQNIRSKITK
jgi:uncharacterized radical SAM superfamily protein